MGFDFGRRDAGRDMNSLASLFCRSVIMADRREIYEWAGGTKADHSDAAIDFGGSESFKGRFDVDNVSWTREVYRAFRNPYVREVTFIGPPQEAGKTIVAQVCLANTIVTRPAKCAFNAATNVKAQQFQERRWETMIQACKKLKERLSDDPHKKKTRQIIFRDGTWLIMQGAEEDANRQSDSVEVQINDEVHLWERPWLTQMHARLRAYKDTRKILNISVGGDKGSELDERFHAGNQGEWSHHCPKCNALFQYVFDHRSPKCTIRFDMTKAFLHADGRLNLADFEKTIRVVCPQAHCKHEMTYDEERLVQMNRTGAYVDMNPAANPEVRSYHVNAFAIGRRTWAEILTPWVRLNLRGGIFNNEILRQFITEELAEMWEDRPIVVSAKLRLGSYTRSQMLKKGEWADEWIRVMSVDNQRGEAGDIPHRWFECWAFSRRGTSRLVDCGRINEWEDVRKKQIDLGVPDWSEKAPGPWVVVDRRFDPVEVDEICSRYKWFGMMGQDADEFLHAGTGNEPPVRMLFSEFRMIDVGFGTEKQGRKHAVYFLWSSQKVQDLYAVLRDGKGETHEIPSDIGEFCPEYAEHLNSHRQAMVKDKKGQERRMWVKIGGHPDHLYDCGCMLVVLGLKAGVFQRE
jgi:hypothetical protein